MAVGFQERVTQPGSRIAVFGKDDRRLAHPAEQPHQHAQLALGFAAGAAASSVRSIADALFDQVAEPRPAQDPVGRQVVDRVCALLRPGKWEPQLDFSCGRCVHQRQPPPQRPHQRVRARQRPLPEHRRQQRRVAYRARPAALAHSRAVYDSSSRCSLRSASESRTRMIGSSPGRRCGSTSDRDRRKQTIGSDGIDASGCAELLELGLVATMRGRRQENDEPRSTGQRMDRGPAGDSPALPRAPRLATSRSQRTSSSGRRASARFTKSVEAR